MHSGLEIDLPTFEQALVLVGTPTCSIYEQALVQSGLDIDLLPYEQVLVQGGQERGHHFWIRPMHLQTRQFLLRLKL